MKFKNYNPQVSRFLEEKKHPEYQLIEKLRYIVLSAHTSIEENIKWNAPNYSLYGEDRITMRLFPVKNFQLVFHCGANNTTLDVQGKINESLTLPILIWKSPNRAIINLETLLSLNQRNTKELVSLIKKWIQITVDK